jgi:hypothetical protein
MIRYDRSSYEHPLDMQHHILKQHQHPLYELQDEPAKPAFIPNSKYPFHETSFLALVLLI